MPNLLANATPTSAYTATAGFGDVTGYDETVSIASTGSVVLVFASIPWQTPASNDSCGLARITRNGTEIPGSVCWQDYSDDTNDAAWATTMVALTGISGSQQFKVQFDERRGAEAVDTGLPGAFVIIEFLDGEAILHETSGLTSSGSAPASYANVPGHTLTFTPDSSASINLMIGAIPCDPSAGSDRFSKAQFALGGTLLGYGETQQGFDNATDEGTGGHHFVAVTGQSGSTTFSQQWVEVTTAEGAEALDTGITRKFQVVEILGSTLHHDADGTDSQTLNSGTFATQPGCSTTETIDDSGSVVLLLHTSNIDFSAGTSDESIQFQFTVGGTNEGPIQQSTYLDDRTELRNTSHAMAWAKTGVSGSTAFSVEWRRTAAHPIVTGTGTEVPRFQVIEIKAAAAGATGTGSITGPTPTISASGAMQPEGSGGVTASTPTVAGAGEQPHSGSGGATATTPDVTAQGHEHATGTGSATANTPDVAAAGGQEFTGSGDVTANTADVAGSGTSLEGLSGSGAVVGSTPSIDALGLADILGTAVILAPTPTVEASGEHAAAGGGDNLAASMIQRRLRLERP